MIPRHVLITKGSFYLIHVIDFGLGENFYLLYHAIILVANYL